ncbi:AraC family transcriptional regulator [Paenibacillus sp. N4]|uniref:helix-turn-helix domain-containing protein n=1 Tax=Paenibacillus vietnamensis TaxID=2590547 RepID=UPI001CD0A1A2|nr:helix-turn-helix domain-containing protein [Paenibacillus vietnamensis]MCA0756735.1 AraC family transcriptional regulator [Paenibacillus vietnamensis]
MRQLWPKRPYIRLFLFIALIFTLLVAPFSIYLSQLFSNHAYQEIDRFNMQKLRHTLQNVEFVTDRLKHDSLSIYQDASIQNWLQAPEDDNRGLLQNDALTALTKYIASEPLIESAYLINMKTRSVIDYRTRKYTFEDFYDQLILRTLTERSDASLRYFSHEVNGRTHQALIVPSSRSGVPYNGYLVMLLNRASLETYLLQSSREEGIETIVTDAGGRIILGLDSPEFKGALRSAPQGESGQYETKISGRKWSVSYSGVSAENWTIYYLTEMSGVTKEASRVQRALLGSSLLLLLLLLTVLFWNTRSAYRRFQLLEERVVDLRQFVDNHKQLIRTEAVRQWLLQGRLLPNHRRELAMETSLLGYPCYYIAIIRIDDYKAFCDKYSFFSRNLLKFAIHNIAAEIVGKNERTVFGVDFGSDHLAFVIGCWEPESSSLVHALEETAEQISNYLNIYTISSLSGKLHADDDFRVAYYRALELTLLKFLTGERKVYEEKDLGAFSRLVNFTEEDELLNALLDTIRFGRKEQVEKNVGDLFHHLQGLAYEECLFQLKLILYRLYRAFGHLTTLESKEGIQSFVDRFGSLSELEDWLILESHSIIQQLGRNLNQSVSVKEEHVKEILTYIHTNLHNPSLSVHDIADHVSLSPGYLRQLFKDHLQVTLAEYILMTRINYVKELMENSDSSITEIAEMAGFLTKSHFFTVFKKATGMTPNEYRKYSKAGHPDTGGGNEG